MGYLAAASQGSEENLGSTHSEKKNNVSVSNTRFIVTKSQERLHSRHKGDKPLSDSMKCRLLGTEHDKPPKEHRRHPIARETRGPRLLEVPREEPGTCWGAD